MTWLALAVAISIEVAASLMLKAAGRGEAWAIALVVCGYAGSFALVSQVVQRLEVGVVYAIWSGVGTAAVASMGIVLLGESLTAWKVAGVALVVAGVALLNLAGGR